MRPKYHHKLKRKYHDVYLHPVILKLTERFERFRLVASSLLKLLGKMDMGEKKLNESSAPVHPSDWSSINAPRCDWI